jgi:flagellar protein FliS
MSDTMFTPVSTRAASAYKRVSVETSVDGASSHHLISLLFDALLESLSLARLALESGDQEVKVRHLSKAVRLIDEGLKASLDEAGGEVTGNLRTVYSYSVRCLTEANLKNDQAKVVEVIGLISPIAEAWKQIGK